MTDTVIIEKRILTAVRIMISVGLIVMLWAAMCGWLS